MGYYATKCPKCGGPATFFSVGAMWIACSQCDKEKAVKGDDMRQFEYKIKTVGGEPGDTVGNSPSGPHDLVLHEAGRQGWELVSVVPTGAGGYWFYFKRYIGSAPNPII